MSIERVTFNGNNQVGTVQNVVHFLNPDGATTHAAMKTYLQTNWINPMLAILHGSFIWTSMTIQKVDGTPGIADSFPISPGQGAQSGDAAPPFVSALIQLHTGLAGRRGRGRIYLPGATIGLFSALGKLTTGSYSAFQTALLNGYRTHFLATGDGPITLVVANRTTPGPDHAGVTALDVRLWASVQRRRNYFIGI